jgi:hypothetical protein
VKAIGLSFDQDRCRSELVMGQPPGAVDGMVDLVGERGPGDGPRDGGRGVGEVGAVGQQCPVRVVPDCGGVWVSLSWAVALRRR